MNLFYHNLNSNSCSGAKFKAFGPLFCVNVVMDSQTNNFSIGVTFWFDEITQIRKNQTIVAPPWAVFYLDHSPLGYITLVPANTPWMSRKNPPPGEYSCQFYDEMISNIEHCSTLWPSGIGSRLGRNRLWVRFLAVSDIYLMFIEPTITWVPSGFSGYIWLDTKIVFEERKRKNMRTILVEKFAQKMLNYIATNASLIV